MSLADFQKFKVQAFRLFDEVAQAAAKVQRADIAPAIAQSRKELEDGKLMILFAGRFKQGKTSLVNTLIGEPGLLPTSPDPMTSVVTTVAYAPSERVTVQIEGESDPRAISRAEIAHFVTEQENARNRLRANVVNISLPAEALRDGLIVVDTPGVDSALNPMHTEATHRYLPLADVVVYVNDVLQPLNSNDLDFIQRAWSSARRMMFVVTKKDLSVDTESIVADNRSKIAQAVGAAPDRIVVIPVSSALADAYRQTADEEDLADSNMRAFSSALWGMLAQERSRLLLGRAGAHSLSALASVIGPLAAEEAALRTKSREELASLREKHEATAQRLQSLQASNANWRSTLQFGLEDIRLAMLARCQTALQDVRTRAYEHIDDPRASREPGALQQLLAKGFADLGNGLSVELRSRAAGLAETVLKETGITLNADLNDISVNPPPEMELREGRGEGGLSRLLTGVSRATALSIAGATLGTLVGGVVAVVTAPVAVPVITVGLAAAGAYTGLTNTYKDGRHRDHQELRAALTREIQPIIEAASRDVQHQVQLGLTQLQREFTTQFTRELETMRATCDRELRSLAQAGKLTEQQSAERLKQLAVSLTLLRGVEARVTAFLAAVDRQVGRGPAPGSAARPSEPEPGEDNTEAAEWVDV